jgi:urease accessory protein UreE
MNVIYQHLTNRKDEEIEELRLIFLSWEQRSKRRKKVKIVNSKQNVR